MSWLKRLFRGGKGERHTAFTLPEGEKGVQRQLESQEVASELSKMTTVIAPDWVLRNGTRYGPMTPGHTMLEQEFSDGSQTVAFLNDIHQTTTSHCNIVWSLANDAVVAEFCSKASGNLIERYVVLRISSGYLCYLAWQA